MLATLLLRRGGVHLEYGYAGQATTREVAESLGSFGKGVPMHVYSYGDLSRHVQELSCVRPRVRGDADELSRVQRLRRRAVFERLLVRLDLTHPGVWVVKGGIALEVRMQERARSTRDLDLGIRQEETDGEILRRDGDRYTECAELCRISVMSSRRLNVSLDEQHAAKLARLADRVRVADGTLARSLLSAAIDDADPDARSITEILEGLPGLPERLAEAEAEVGAGSTTELEEL
jgi:hypothetical protein